MSDRGQPTHASPDPTPEDPETPTAPASTTPEPSIHTYTSLPPQHPTPELPSPTNSPREPQPLMPEIPRYGDPLPEPHPLMPETSGYADPLPEPHPLKPEISRYGDSLPEPQPLMPETSGYTDPAPEAERPSDTARPLELSSGDSSDTPFRLTAPHSDEPGPATEGAPRNRRTRTIVLSGLLVAALAGAAAIGWWGWQVNTQRQTNLATPTKIGALTLDDSEQAAATADYLQTALSAEISMTKAVGAVYTDSTEKTVLFFGGTTLLWSPESDLDSAFSLVSDDQGAVTNLHEVDAGPFGGTMKCGLTSSPEGDITVCGWADHGSLALAMFPNRPEPEAAPLMRELRAATQTRN